MAHRLSWMRFSGPGMPLAPVSSCSDSPTLAALRVSFASAVGVLPFPDFRMVFSVIVRVLCGKGFAFPITRSPDVPITRSAYPHPAFFQLLLQAKHFRKSTLGPPLRHAWVALGPRLGHPRATQTQSQPQESAEGRKIPQNTKRNGFPLRILPIFAIAKLCIPSH